MSASLRYSSSKSALPLMLVTEDHFADWLKKQSSQHQNWAGQQGLSGREGEVLTLPAEDGSVAMAVAVVGDTPDIWSLAHLPSRLPEFLWRPDCSALPAAWKKPAVLEKLAIGWALDDYQYDLFTSNGNRSAQAVLELPAKAKAAQVKSMITATTLVRDLVNAPVNVMGPVQLADEARKLARQHKATCQVTVGDALLKKNYPAIHTVGRASDQAPRLIDLRWGKASHPKVTLVGKGVCFDTGGLDIKSSSSMKLMKKDMGGAAQVLGLAHLIMASKLPVRLRVLIPAVENNISANAYRTSDVITTRKGLTVEVGNTDAEGRLVLCDALCEADREKPELLIDCATLTGAARVALGTDMPAFFTDDNKIARLLETASIEEDDPLWRLPLVDVYERYLDSSVADLSSTGSSRYGGAITAALFLRHFVEHSSAWVHLDLMAWNLSGRPGRPRGGEAMGMRALFAAIKKYIS